MRRNTSTVHTARVPPVSDRVRIGLPVHWNGSFSPKVKISLSPEVWHLCACSRCSGTKVYRLKPQPGLRKSRILPFVSACGGILIQTENLFSLALRKVCPELVKQRNCGTADWKWNVSTWEVEFRLKSQESLSWTCENKGIVEMQIKNEMSALEPSVIWLITAAGCLSVQPQRWHLPKVDKNCMN